MAATTASIVAALASRSFHEFMTRVPFSMPEDRQRPAAGLCVAARKLRRAARGKCLRPSLQAKLGLVQVALDAMQDLVVDPAFVPQAQQLLPLRFGGRHHRRKFALREVPFSLVHAGGPVALERLPTLVKLTLV